MRLFDAPELPKSPTVTIGILAYFFLGVFAAFSLTPYNDPTWQGALAAWAAPYILMVSFTRHLVERSIGTLIRFSYLCLIACMAMSFYHYTHNNGGGVIGFGFLGSLFLATLSLENYSRIKKLPLATI